MPFYESGAARAGFDAGIQSALRMLLTRPKFLFRDALEGVRKLVEEPVLRRAFLPVRSIPHDRIRGREAQHLSRRST